MRIQSVAALLGLPARTRAVIAANLVSSVGTGLVQPFLVLYLTKVRQVPVGTATAVIAVIALASVVGGPVAGRLVDNVSLRVTAAGAMTLAAAGTAGFAFVVTAREAVVSGLVYGVAYGAMQSVWNTAMARDVRGEHRATAFGMQFVGLNIGVGLGGVLGGLFASTADATSFQWLYAGDACSFLLAGAVLVLAVGGRETAAAEPAEDEGAGAPGYGVVLRDRNFLRVLVFTTTLMIVGYGQLESSIPGLVAVTGIDARVMAWAFVANTVCIVVLQFAAITRITRVRPAVLLAGTSAAWALCWLLLLTTSGAPLGAAPALVICAVAVFAVGEALLSVSLPTLVNGLASDRLRGRYNGAYSAAMSVGLVIGPLLGGQLLATGHTWLLSAVLGLGATCCIGYALVLGRQLPGTPAPATPKTDHLLEDVHPGGAP
ncbi:major facilitator superfamily MFS_1 [Actinobacteria bacterium OK074]|nr:major facilitator superfamily MFS_1 [Actinobacteria bacterium OK074]